MILVKHMRDWQTLIKYDPMASLLSSGDEAVVFFVQRDLLGKTDGRPEDLWNLPAARKIVEKQLPDGSWKYPSSQKAYRLPDSYAQTETYRNLGILVEKFGYDRRSPAVAKAAEFLLGFQTAAGDIRGILGKQYVPYYNGGILELLIKVGYADDPRVDKVFGWFESTRQDDGGWAIPLRTHGKALGFIATDAPALEPNRAQPSSHLVTGMVLRAYAAHPRYCHSATAKQAGELLLSRLFQADRYADRRAADFWFRFTFPFWFTDLISALDTLSLLGFSTDEPPMARALQWLAERQQPDGLWQLKTVRGGKGLDTDRWLSLVICRILKRL